MSLAKKEELLRSSFITLLEGITSNSHVDAFYTLLIGLEKLYKHLDPRYEPLYWFDGEYLRDGKSRVIEYFQLEELLSFPVFEDYELDKLLLGPLEKNFSLEWFPVSSFDMRSVLAYYLKQEGIEKASEVFLGENSIEKFSKFLYELSIFFTISYHDIVDGLVVLFDDKEYSSITEPDYRREICCGIFQYFERFECAGKRLDFTNCPTDPATDEYRIAQKMLHLLTGEPEALRKCSYYYKAIRKLPWFVEDAEYNIEFEFFIYLYSSQKWGRYINLPQNFKSKHYSICRQLDVFFHYIQHCFDEASESLCCFDGVWSDQDGFHISIATGYESGACTEFGLDKIYLSMGIASMLAAPYLDKILKLYDKGL